MGYEPVGRIAPVAPSPSLLTSARPLPDVNWSTGISWQTGCQPSFAWPWCPDFVQSVELIFDPERGEVQEVAPGTYKEVADERTIVHTMPFVIYTPTYCDGIGPVDTADTEAMMSALTEVHTAAGLAAALWMGTGLPADDLTIPTLRRSAVDVSAANPLDLDDGVASLLAHYQTATGGNGGAVIHMPGALAISALGGVSGGARVMWPEGNQYRTAHGATVVPGPGYPEGFSATGPDGHGPLIAEGPPEEYAGNEAGTSWIYVTGPVEYAVSPVRIFPEPNERVLPRLNIYGAFGERDAIVRFDPCSVFAVEVWNPALLLEVS